jgi:signal transduction histidine kinase
MANIDCKKIEQVLINLLLNAVKYSPQGSDVKVTIEQAQNDEQLISFLGKSPHISLPCMIVCVRDSGVGIPENELELVFEKYYRVDNKLNRTVPGMGMGLHICKVIVEAHGGHIWAKSNDGGGSTFAFSVPLQEPSAVVRQLKLDLHYELDSPASVLSRKYVDKVV